MRGFFKIIGVIILISLPCWIIGSQLGVVEAQTPLIEKVIITKPVIPKIIYHGIYADLNKVNNEVTTLTREGYVNIRVSGANSNQDREDWFLIAEKY